MHSTAVRSTGSACMHEPREEHAESFHIGGLRVLRHGLRICKHHVVEIIGERRVRMPQIAGEHRHAPGTAFRRRRHHADRRIERGGEDALRHNGRGEDAAMPLTSESICCTPLVMGHHIHADRDRRKRAEQLRAHEVCEVEPSLRLTHEQRRPSASPARNSPVRNG